MTLGIYLTSPTERNSSASDLHHFVWDWLVFVLFFSLFFSSRFLQQSLPRFLRCLYNQCREYCVSFFLQLAEGLSCCVRWSHKAFCSSREKCRALSTGETKCNTRRTWRAIAVAQTPFSVLQVSIPPKRFWSCYFKVKLLHNVALKAGPVVSKLTQSLHHLRYNDWKQFRMERGQTLFTMWNCMQTACIPHSERQRPWSP